MTRLQLKEFACHENWHVRRCASRALRYWNTLEIRRENIKRIEEYVRNRR